MTLKFIKEIGETSSPGQTSPSDRNIHEAEIVFNPTRFYGHKTSEEDKENFVEIRGYKWGKSHFHLLVEDFSNFKMASNVCCSTSQQ